MINSQEFTALINARCNLALLPSTEYHELEEKLLEALKKVDRQIANEIDEITAAQQALVEELVYRQGMKDALSLLK